MKAFTLLETRFKGVGVAHLGTKLISSVPHLPPPPRKVLQTAAERIAELEDESSRLFAAMFGHMKSSAEERYAQHERYNEIEAKLEELKASLAEETSRRLALEASVQELDEEKTTVEAERDELADSLVAAETRFTEITAARDNLRNSLISITTERDDLRTNLIKSKAEADTTMRTLAAYRDKLTDTLEESREEVGALKAEIKFLQADYQILKEGTNGIVVKSLKIRERAETAENEVEELKERMKKDRFESDKAVSDVSSEWASVVNQLTATKREFMKQKRIGKEEKASVAHTTALLKSSRDEIFVLREKLDDAQSQILSQAAAIEELKECHSSEVNLVNSGIFELIDILEGAHSAQIDLDKKLVDVEACLQHEKARSTALEKEVGVLTTQLNAEREVSVTAQSAHLLTQDTLATVRSRLDDIVAENERSETLLIQTKTLHDNTCDRLARVTEDSRRLSRDLKQVAEQRDRLLDESLFSNSSDEDLRSMIATLTKESTSLKVSKKSIEDSFAQKRDQCEALHVEVLRLTQIALAPEGANAPFAVSTPLRSKNLNIGSNVSPSLKSIFGASRFVNAGDMTGGLPTPTRSFSMSVMNFFKPSADINSPGLGYESPVLS